MESRVFFFNPAKAHLFVCGALVIALFGSGCARPAFDRRPFTVVMLPDTQIYSKSYPDCFLAQTNWIKAHRAKENIVFVTHIGDIVNDHSRDKDMYQWDTAARAMAVLDGVVPWGVAIGNHDYDTEGEKEGRATVFLKNLGPSRFEGRPWYGGASPGGLNSYQLFSAAGFDFIGFHLEVDVPDEAVAWAKDVLSRYPNRAAIVSLHAYLKGRDGITRNPKRCCRKTGNSGEKIWDKLIRSSPQIFMVLCGHEGRTDEYYQVSSNDAGHPVIEMLADYQKRESGGNGFLRLIRFVPARGEIEVRTYSPVLRQFESDSNSQFVLPWDIPDACRKGARQMTGGYAACPGCW